MEELDFEELPISFYEDLPEELSADITESSFSLLVLENEPVLISTVFLARETDDREIDLLERAIERNLASVYGACLGSDSTPDCVGREWMKNHAHSHEEDHKPQKRDSFSFVCNHPKVSFYFEDDSWQLRRL